MIRKVPEYLYDIRLVNRHIDMGVVTAKEHAEWVQSLNDATEHKESFSIEMESLKSKVGSKRVEETPGDETTAM